MPSLWWQIPWNDLLGAMVGYMHYYIQDEVKPDAAIAKKEAASGKKPAKAGLDGRTLGGTGATNGGGGSAAGSGGKSRRKARKANIATFANTPSCGPSG